MRLPPGQGSLPWRKSRSPSHPVTAGGPIMRLIVRGWLAATAIASVVAARAHAQEPVTITGKVTSDAGLPLGQVEIALPTLGLGAPSKDDGSHTLVVPGARGAGQNGPLPARR